MAAANTAPVGHLLTHAGEPPHKSHTRGMPEGSIRMAPKGHAFAQAPHDTHFSRSSTRPPVSGLRVSAPAGHARTQGGVPGMGVIYKVKVLNGEGSSSRSSRQGRPR